MMPLRPIVPLTAPRLLLNREVQQRAGGGNRTLLPARHGSPPPMAQHVFIPPRSAPDPKLPMPMSVAFPSPTIEIDAAQVGDPLSKLQVGEFGTNGNRGIGSRGGGDIGPGPGGSGVITTGREREVTPPKLIYKIEPEFSEEARKAKYQGVVVLAIEVDTSGHPRNLKIVQGLGLGLDEKAIDAVARWLFRPGLQAGKPVVTNATVEVTFRLL
jgi:periplasmic protein TonB